MSKLLFLHTPHFTPKKLHTKTFSAIVTQSLTPLHCKCRLLSFSLNTTTTRSNSHLLSQIHYHRRSFSVRSFDDSSSETKIQEPQQQAVVNEDYESRGKSKDEDEYPSGEFEYEKFSAWKIFTVKLRMLVAFPWERVRKGSVLTMKLRGQVLFLFFYALWNLRDDLCLIPVVFFFFLCWCCHVAQILKCHWWIHGMVNRITLVYYYMLWYLKNRTLCFVAEISKIFF